MKLLVVIVQDADARRLEDAFAENKVPFTRVASTGGFLRQGNTTLLSGVEDGQIEGVKQLVGESCSARTARVTGWELPDINAADFASESAEVTVGGAVVFVLEVEAFVKL